jgi:hypothetical protein
MTRVVLILALCGSCARHPAITVGVAAGSVGLLSCEVNGASQQACGIISGSVGLVLGGIAALVTYFADTNAHALPSDDEILPNGAVRVHTHTELPPVPLDGGVPDAPPPVDAAPVDGAPSPDA